MYNRILKRPMFKRGGSSFQAQGTGITSPYDIPRGGYYGGGTIGGGAIRGNPMGYRTGFQDPKPDTFEQIDVETKEIFKTPKGQWLDDVIGSFGAYSTPYKDDGSAKIYDTGLLSNEAQQAVGMLAFTNQLRQVLDASSQLFSNVVTNNLSEEAIVEQVVSESEVVEEDNADETDTK